MSQSIPDADPRVLGTLLTAHSAFSIFSDKQRMGEFIQRTVEGVPGVSSCGLCLRGGQQPRLGAADIHECEACATHRVEIGQGARDQCPLSNRPEIRVFPLHTQEAHYGFLLVKLKNDRPFAPYEPFVNNLANSLALNEERRWQKQQLETANDELLGLRDHLQNLVEKRTVELQTANDRLLHLNAVLRSIRGVNQIIVRERSPERLVQTVCECLIETRSYFNAWIALAEPSGELIPRGMAGTDEVCISTVQQLGPANELHCIASALKHPGVVVGEDPNTTCSGCSLSQKKVPGRSAMAIRLEHRGRVFGVLVVSADRKFAIDEEEHALLGEVAKDIGLALHSIEDGSARKLAEHALEASETRYRSLFESAKDGILILDADTGKIVDVNPFLMELTGHSHDDFLGKHLWEIGPFRDIAASRASFADLQANMYARHEDLPLKARDGRMIDVEFVSNVYRVDNQTLIQCNFRDITARKRAVTEREKLEEQLRVSQKLEAVGRLAGGVAHDFNNMLGAIIGYTDVLLHDLHKEDPLYGDVDEIRRAADRAAGLTGQLLAFSRKQILAPEIMNLNKTVADTENMLRRTIGEDIDFVTHLASDLGNTKADPGQIQQVILNLAVNARDAMLDGGKLTIETRNVRLDEDYVSRHPYATAGRHVMLAVSDTGTGMDAEIKGKLFEPFFTTKGKNKGTGLGLSTVYGIVKQSGGSIEVYSEPGHGSTFKVYLPRVEGEVRERVRRKTLSESPRGGETVLLAEDEQALCRLVSRILRSAGYKVLEANHGGEALVLCEQHSGTIDLVITDVVMPHMSGRELAEKVKGMRPEVKVLYSSGYTDNAIVHHGVLEPDMHFIHKPFAANALLTKVREVLDGMEDGE